MAAVHYHGFSITRFWAMGPLGLAIISITVPNLVQKCWSTPKLWPKIEIQDGGRPPSWIFENLTSEHWVVAKFPKKNWKLCSVKALFKQDDERGSATAWWRSAENSTYRGKRMDTLLSSLFPRKMSWVQVKACVRLHYGQKERSCRLQPVVC